ncbi:MAG: sigma-70 family RNA polymerase sigma factor [Acidimicrobiia bacterium]|nr:sigma-70 family RNA polymerase sigma factor [Acidimicrobiia bacterium]
MIAAARDGDTSSFGELVRRHQAVAFRVAVVITRSPVEAHDVAQEAFVKAWLAIDRFDQTLPFRPWLLRIVANEARNRNRSSGRRIHRENLAGVRDTALVYGQSSAETAVMRNAESARVVAAVDALPEQFRQVVYLRYFLELDEAETAEALSIPRGTVKSRTSRARALLAEQLEVNDG